MQRNVGKKPVVLAKRNSISNKSLQPQSSTMSVRKRTKFSLSDDDSEADSIYDGSDRDEDEDDENQQSESDTGKKDQKATPRGRGTNARSKKKDGTRLINSHIKALHPNSTVVINEDEIEAVSALYLVGYDRRKSSAFVNVPPDLDHIKDIDAVARALLRTFVYQFFFLTTSHAFLSLYTLLVDDEIPGASEINKALSQKAFYDWSHWTTAAKKRTIKRDSRVLDSAFRWQDTFTAERTTFLHGMILNLEKPSPAFFLTLCVSAMVDITVTMAV